MCIKYNVCYLGFWFWIGLGLFVGCYVIDNVFWIIIKRFVLVDIEWG